MQLQRIIEFLKALIRISICSSNCPKCGGSQIIPLDTPKAKALLNKGE